MVVAGESIPPLSAPSARKLLYVDPTACLRARLEAAALANGSTLRHCASRDEASALLNGSAPCKLIVIAANDGAPDGLSTTAGLELVRALRTLIHRQTTPILFAIARADVTIASQAFQAGATEVFLLDDEHGARELVDHHLSQNEQPRFKGNVLVVEDNPLFAELTGTYCRAQGLRVTICRDFDTAVARLAARRYHLAIVDIVLDGMQSGLALVRHIRNQPTIAAMPVLVVSGYRDTARRIEALRAGANDYLEKPFAEAELIYRLHRMYDNDDTPTAPQDLLHQAHDEWHSKGLSQREREICAAMVRGMADKDIATELGISFWTVRSHIGNIFTKLGLLNRRELMGRYLPSDE